ncbi:hypothetical protein K523DRAFT_3116 [Schizophyllum commune Tattone D]|nr:hypothetical protein K523DRAFT_3116 [Schizophyllum commune Tattone D]
MLSFRHSCARPSRSARYVSGEMRCVREPLPAVDELDTAGCASSWQRAHQPLTAGMLGAERHPTGELALGTRRVRAARRPARAREERAAASRAALGAFSAFAENTSGELAEARVTASAGQSGWRRGKRTMGTCRASGWRRAGGCGGKGVGKAAGSTWVRVGERAAGRRRRAHCARRRRGFGDDGGDGLLGISRGASSVAVFVAGCCIRQCIMAL